MKERIEKTFADMEEIPLFYIESGSRLWGIASPDSDFDVRGIHLHSKRQCFDFKSHRDTIEILDGDFDLVSYEIGKMFGLLAKGNPNVFEWIRSNIIYFNNLPQWPELQTKIVENFDFGALFHHYRSLAKRHIRLMEAGKKFTYKAAFYCIRGLLSAELAARQIIPELLIDDLFEQIDGSSKVLEIAKDSLDRKKQQAEKENVPEPEQQKILTAITGFSQQLESKTPKKGNNRQKLESVLSSYSHFIRTQYYG